MDFEPSGKLGGVSEGSCGVAGGVDDLDEVDAVELDAEEEAGEAELDNARVTELFSPEITSSIVAMLAVTLTLLGGKTHCVSDVSKVFASALSLGSNRVIMSATLILLPISSRFGAVAGA